MCFIGFTRFTGQDLQDGIYRDLQDSHDLRDSIYGTIYGTATILQDLQDSHRFTGQPGFTDLRDSHNFEVRVYRTAIILNDLQYRFTGLPIYRTTDLQDSQDLPGIYRTGIYRTATILKNLSKHNLSANV